MFHGLDLTGRAEVLGLSGRDYVALGTRDPRIVAWPSLQTAGAIARLKRWIASGSPDVDDTRLEFAGDDDVRALVVGVIRTVPTAVAWHAVEHVSWFEVGRQTAGWMGLAPTMRKPDGDVAHVIAIAGAADDDYLRGVIAHELGHSWSRAVHETPPDRERMSRLEWTARALVASKFCGVTPERFVRERVANETLADELAKLWGYARHTDGEMLSRHFTDEHADVAELAAEIERETERAL